MKLGKFVVKNRIPIVIISLVLCALSVIGMVKTRINFDMLTYLPKDFETVQGQDILLEDFGKGAFSMVIVENMTQKEVAELKSKFEAVDHVESVIWYDSFMQVDVPMEILPESVYNAFNNEDATVMAVFFDSSTSADVTIEAVQKIKEIGGEQAFVSGMSATVTDLKELCEQEEPIYVAIAVACAILIMMLCLDNWLTPIIFIISIGIAILINLGSNIFLGEISYITKALAAVLQLAVTMDYSIFLWHSFNEYREKGNESKEAMASAIHDTFLSVLGSSITTIAGFIALCFMSYTLGIDLGIVMAKGVLIGVIGAVTVLPSLILMSEKLLDKTKHKCIIPDCEKLSRGILKIFPVFIVISLALAVPAYIGYKETNDSTYYEISQSLPEDMDFRVANEKLQDEFNMANVQMILLNSDLEPAQIREMIGKLEEIPGVSSVLGLESILGSKVPSEILPESITGMLDSGNYKLYLMSSEYKIATDEIEEQLKDVKSTIKSYDSGALLIGEAACTQDLIDVTDVDFSTVTTISIVLVFIIIMIVEKSISLPIILVALIELGIFINLGIPYYAGEKLPFITPICISTIQLGATVDYAILMTTRYKAERCGQDGREALGKKDAILVALKTSIPSILTSGLGLFAATFGVYIYTSIDMIGSMCLLLARGAVISILLVVLVLPALLMVFDGVIRRTTIGMKNCG